MKRLDIHAFHMGTGFIVRYILDDNFDPEIKLKKHRDKYGPETSYQVTDMGDSCILITNAIGQTTLIDERANKVISLV